MQSVYLHLHIKSTSPIINMKTFVALCILAFVVAAQAEQAAKLPKSYKNCRQSTKVAKDLLIKARNGDFADDKNLNDFYTCKFKEAGLIDDEGHLKVEVIKERLLTRMSSEDVDKVVTACDKVQSEPTEQICKLAYKCYLAESPVKTHPIDE